MNHTVKEDDLVVASRDLYRLDGIKTLSAGKIYEVVEVSNRHFFIINDARFRAGFVNGDNKFFQNREDDIDDVSFPTWEVFFAELSIAANLNFTESQLNKWKELKDRVKNNYETPVRKINK